MNYTARAVIAGAMAGTLLGGALAVLAMTEYRADSVRLSDATTARIAAEDYGYEAGLQAGYESGYDDGIGDGMTEGFREGRAMVLDVIASCAEDEIVIHDGDRIYCHPMDDSDFRKGGWVAK